MKYLVFCSFFLLSCIPWKHQKPTHEYRADTIEIRLLSSSISYCDGDTLILPLEITNNDSVVHELPLGRRLFQLSWIPEEYFLHGDYLLFSNVTEGDSNSVTFFPIEPKQTRQLTLQFIPNQDQLHTLGKRNVMLSYEIIVDLEKKREKYYVESKDTLVLDMTCPK